MNNEIHLAALYFAGAGQIFIALIYDWVRKILGWDAAIAAMPTRLNQQIAHTYSRYIQALNFAFGVITIVLANEFVKEPRFGAAFAGLLMLYWGVRTVIALAHYDVSEVAERRPLFKWGNRGFNLLFAVMALIYAWTVYLAWEAI